ncbi:hypothetical protein JTB14_016228 [Gonioctena quinquepunctata]|nr:hypothetical protein JTB14_016228 [Gonioctena quinquepunctata]
MSVTTASAAGSSGTPPVVTMASMPMIYSLGMIASTLDNFSGKEEEQLDLDKAEKLVKLQETTTMMITGKNSVGKVAQVNEDRTCYTLHYTMRMYAQKKKVSRKMQIGTEELDVMEMDVTIMDVGMGSTAKEGVNGGHFETTWTRWKEFIARTRGFEERRGNRSRGTRRQMEKKCGIMRAQIPQIDLEEIPYIVTLVVNGQQCDCLVDTGAVVTLVRKRIIPVGDIDTERRTEVRLVSVTGHRLEIFGTTCLRFKIDNCRKEVEFEAYVCENETTGPTQYTRSLAEKSVSRKKGAEEVARKGGKETGNRERLGQMVRSGPKMVKNLWKEKNIPGKSCLKKRTENGGTPLEKEEIGIQIEMVMKKEEKRTKELEEGGSQMIIGSGRTPLVTNEIGTQTEKWMENEKEPFEEMDKENGRRSCVEMEIQVIEDEKKRLSWKKKFRIHKLF